MAGVILVLLSFVVLAFSLGILARCGHGEGLCFDTPTHAAGDAGLVLFVLSFIIGVALIAATGSTASFQTRTKTPEAAPPLITNVYPAAPAPQPTVTNVYPQAPAPQPRVTNVSPKAPVAPTTTVVVTPHP
ncbi:MAG: hypothetical protein L3K10_02875 [Thermoplasmata archaeon]|nr:hypothetical protein [Thermoplasmata archaeon]